MENIHMSHRLPTKKIISKILRKHFWAFVLLLGIIGSYLIYCNLNRPIPPEYKWIFIPYTLAALVYLSYFLFPFFRYRYIRSLQFQEECREFIVEYYFPFLRLPAPRRFAPVEYVGLQMAGDEGKKEAGLVIKTTDGKEFFIPSRDYEESLGSKRVEAFIRDLNY